MFVILNIVGKYFLVDAGFTNGLGFDYLKQLH